MTSTFEESVELGVPVRTAYDQWTQLEDFPLFMSSVASVEQLDDRHVRWSAKVGGRTHEWKTEICEQVPDKRIAWRSLSGPWNAGVVTFHRLADDRSKVMVQLEYTPEGMVETAHDVLGLARRQLSKELLGFKEFLESRGKATGAWRGSIPSKDDG